MSTLWWILLAFLGGGMAGILLMALARVAGDEPRQLSPVRELPIRPVQRGAESIAAGRR